RRWRDEPEERLGAQLFRGGGHDIAEVAQHISPLLRRVHGYGGHHDGADGMRPEFKRGDDPEVTAPTADRPEEVGVFCRTGGEKAAIGCDDISRQQIVAAETIFAPEPSEPTSQRQARYPSRRDNATRRGEAEDLCFMIELSPGDAALNPRCLSL